MAKKPSYRAIPRPTKAELLATVQALVTNVELLTRQTGDEASWPLTVSDARTLGLIPETTKLPNAPQKKGNE